MYKLLKGKTSRLFAVTLQIKGQFFKWHLLAAVCRSFRESVFVLAISNWRFVYLFVWRRVAGDVTGGCERSAFPDPLYRLHHWQTETSLQEKGYVVLCNSSGKNCLLRLKKFFLPAQAWLTYCRKEKEEWEELHELGLLDLPVFRETQLLLWL